MSRNHIGNFMQMFCTFCARTDLPGGSTCILETIEFCDRFNCSLDCPRVILVFLEEKPAVVRELSSFPRLGITLLFILDVCLEASAGAWVASPKRYRQKKRDASHQVAAWKNTSRDFLLLVVFLGLFPHPALG